MSRRLVVTLVVAGLVAIGIAAVVLWQCFFKQEFTTVHYRDNNDVLVNPDRGFYKQISSTEPKRVARMDADMKLVLLEYDIAAYRDVPLPQEKLTELDTFLTVANDNGKSVIFRAAYGFDKSAADNDATSLDQVREHIAQISPLLNAHKDTVYCVQAGFLGPWGEWHSSLLLTDKSESEQVAVRNGVLSALLEALDDSIVVNLRRPSFIRDAQLAGVDITRVGFHNDGLLASDTDLGTYEDNMRESDNAWFSANVKSGINGGEMPKVSTLTFPTTAVKELKSWRISYLNAYYNTIVLDGWASDQYNGENALSYITNHLGYRFFVESLTYPNKLAVGADEIPVTFTLANSGNAPIRTGYTLRWAVIQNGAVLHDGIAIEDMSVVTDSTEVTINIPVTKTMSQELQPWVLTLTAQGHGNTVTLSTGSELLSAATADGRMVLTPQ